MSKPNSKPTTEVYAYPPIGKRKVYAKTVKKLMAIHALPEITRLLSRLLIIFFLFMMIFLIIIPWQQTSTGSGRVIAYKPQDRVQNIHASVAGRIKKWFVTEGSIVKKDDPILEMIDIDPQFLERLNLELQAVESQYEAAQSVTRTAQIDKQRQEGLFKKGINSRKDMEIAIIAFKNAQSAEAQALSNLTQVKSKISRQHTQMVRAPSDGTIIRLLIGSTSVIVNQGDVVAVFVPKSDILSAELFVSGNDLPLIYNGRKVRLQFSGWPVIQFSGWPSVAIGTFGGVVTFVDQTASSNGLFRVIVIPGENDKWPQSRFIRQGTQVNGWILLNQVALGYEIWRQFNAFPPSMSGAPENELGAPTLTIPE